MVTIDAERCSPAGCPSGRGAARAVCPPRAIVQLDLGDPPALDTGRCRSCGKCALACPSRAIRLEP